MPNIPALLLALLGQLPAAELVEADLVVYGNTSAGIVAAIQGQRLGLDVVLVGPEQRLGGLTSSGLGWTDSGRKEVVGGLSREFYRRVKAVYDKDATWKWQRPEEYGRYRAEADAQWTFEPSVAERVFEDWVRGEGVAVRRGEWLDRENGVDVVDGRIVEIRMLSGLRLRASVFVDAGYEGDLLAAAGVSYATGREANAVYGETLNGVQPGRPHHQFVRDVSPYRVPGDPQSGLLPRVSAEPLGAPGSGDRRIQAYNFRVCLTRVKENQVPFPKPQGYDAAQYELLLRTLLAGSDHYRGKFDMLPNGKTDTNNSGSFSTDNIGFNYDYPEASYARRAEIIEEHRRYQQGFYWFLANDPRVPEDDRAWMREWGLAKDEFAGSGHWPPQIYVREARRMLGEFVVTENHVRRLQPTLRSIGMGSYNMDSHHVQRYVDADGFVRNEGDVQVSPGGPYPIDLGAILPRRAECQNLLVTCAVSASHIAYGSIRMEPVFMVLGHSAADVAALAIEGKQAVQDVPFALLAAQLLAEGQVLAFESHRSGEARALDLSNSPGVVVDDEAEWAKLLGDWTPSQSTPPFVGSGYLHDGNRGQDCEERDTNGECYCGVSYMTSLPYSGRYEVRLYYPPHPNRASNAEVRIVTRDGVVTQRISQRETDPGKPYRSLGEFDLDGAALLLRHIEADGYVVADAVEFVPLEPTLRTWGTMRHVLKLGNTQARVTPVEVVKPTSIAVGAMAGLGGEITVIDGETWVAEPIPGSTADQAPRLRRATAHDQATLFVQADVPAWQEIELGACRDYAELETKIGAQLDRLGWSRTAPTPVRVRGQATALEMHVIRGACPIAQPEGPAPWRLQQSVSAQQAIEVELVGIYAEQAAGRLTHHTHVSHLHAKTAQSMGHLDGISLRQATLLLPTQPARLLTNGQ